MSASFAPPDRRGADEAAPAFPFQNPDLPADARIRDLLARMSVEEKIASLGTDPSVPRLGVRGSDHVEGLHGLALTGPADWAGQGLPPVHTTTFPQAIGLAMTWDVECVQLVASVEGLEARYAWQSEKYRRGGIVVRAPNADLGRDPRWGRTEECYGEDAYLTGTLVVAFVRGLQGGHPRYWQAASLLKHFLANSHEDERTFSSSDFDARLWREYYSAPFRRGIVEGGSRAFMAAYNAVNGTPCHVHPMLREIAMGEWKQDGIICTDGGGLKLLVTDHKTSPDLLHAAAATIKAGINQYLDDHRAAVTAALAEGKLAEADLDEALHRVFRVMIKLGLLDPAEQVPYAQIGQGPEPWLGGEHRAAARRVTQKSIVLLKNAPLDSDGPLLPLDRAKIASLALIGPLADAVHLDWYSGTPPYSVTPLEGVRENFSSATVVRHARGDDLAAAVALARESEVVVLCVGNHPTGEAGWAKVSRPSYGKEGVDRLSLTLDEEVELIPAVLAANPRTVVVLIASFPYAIAWTQEHVPAIVHVTHNSQELGRALADVLFGVANPAGRLVQTWPRRLDQLPPRLDYDLRLGRTYQYFTGDPLYPFGFGLSYTTFQYVALSISSETLPADGEVDVIVTVNNTGGRDGEEVVQLYVEHLDSQVPRPQRELRDFARVAIGAGQSRRVPLRVEAASLAYWHEGKNDWVVEPGRVRIRVGGSSAQLPLEATVVIRTS